MTRRRAFDPKPLGGADKAARSRWLGQCCYAPTARGSDRSAAIRISSARHGFGI
jgi:hypothetical protein